MIPLIGPISDFTLGESLLSPEDIAQRAKQLGYSAVALTDDHLTSMTRFAKACKKHEIRPIFGARLTIFDEPTDKTPPKQRENPNRSFKVKVFPKNEEGIQHLYRLISVANDKEHFYYVPRLGYTELVDALASKTLCIASGDIFAHEQGARLWTGIRRATGASSAFHELFAVPTPYYTRLNQEAIQANDGTSPYLLSRPMLYLEPEQADTLDILRSILSNTTINAPWRKIPFSRDLSMIDPQELMAHVKATQELLSKRMDVPDDLWKQALLGTNELAKQAQWQWHKRDITLPSLVRDETGELNRLIAEGWRKRLFSPVLGYRPTDLQPYKDRLVHELSIIKQMGFVRYFLMVADLVTWAKAKSIPVGPGRGSCFVSGTRVILNKSGLTKRIEDMEVGDAVVSHDGSTQFVTDTMRFFCDEEILDLEFDNGAKISCTKDHLFFTKNRGWVEAQHLSEDDDIEDVRCKGDQPKAGALPRRN